MANPQKEEGYTAIANEIMEALCRIRIRGEEMQVLNVILRKTYGWKKCEDTIALSKFVEMTGMKKPNVVRAISGLLSKMIIIVIKNDNAPAHVYKFNKDYDKWVPLSKKMVFLDGSRTITNESIKANIRKRDGNSCVICGHTGEMLPVHHIDYDQGNNDESNLITLCITCHSRTNSNYDYWREELSKKITDVLLSKVITNVIKSDNPSLSKVIPTKETTTKAKKTSADIFFPEWLPKETWEEYLEMRTRIKKPLLKKSFPRLWKELEKLKKKGNPVEEVLNQSIIGSWQGVFELKKSSKPSNEEIFRGAI
jgi:phage replication O-like protein O